MIISPALYKKYNIPAPRYTSYPTVPYWDEKKFKKEKYIDLLQQSFHKYYDEGISVYIHLPYCESLCTFCACNKRITKQHSVEEPYIDHLIKEWDLYMQLLGKPPIIRELHLGGGTPTFFSVSNLTRLLEHIQRTSAIASDYEFSFEGHPNNTTKAHLEALYNIGFRRVSFGVQDYDPVVQKAINRIQSYDQVAQVTQWARDLGYTSISHDLIFGLPFQQVASITDSILKTNQLRPDRIAFYSYAHVPWIKGVGQRGFSDDDIPQGEEKRKLYETGKKLLEDMGYYEIAMDHFARAEDELYIAYQDGTIHRNFMGYTSKHTHLMISLGVSSIGDSWTGFAQNAKTIEEYYEALDATTLPIVNGHILDDEDIAIRTVILDIMCRFRVDISNLPMSAKDEILDRLRTLSDDNLLTIIDDIILVNPLGKVFLRNIALALDLRYFRRVPDGKIFSMSI